MFAFETVAEPAGRGYTASCNKAPQWEKPRSQSSTRMRISFWNSIISWPLFSPQTCLCQSLPLGKYHSGYVLDKLLFASFLLWRTEAFMNRLKSIFYWKFSWPFSKLFQQIFRSWLKQLIWQQFGNLSVWTAFYLAPFVVLLLITHWHGALLFVDVKYTVKAQLSSLVCYVAWVQKSLYMFMIIETKMF